MKGRFLLFVFIFVMIDMVFGKSFYEVSAGLSQTYTWSCCEGRWGQAPLPFFSLGIGNATEKDGISLLFQVQPLPMKNSIRDGEFQLPDGSIKIIDEDYKRTCLLLGSYRTLIFWKVFLRLYLGISEVLVHGSVSIKGKGIVHQYNSEEFGITAGGGLAFPIGRKSKTFFYTEIFALHTEILSLGEKSFPQILLGIRVSAEF